MAEKHESGCTCLECQVGNADDRRERVFKFCFAATLVAVVWGSIRLGAGMGLSWQVILLAPVAIAVTGVLLYLVIGWRKPCANESDRARQTEQRYRRWLELGEVSQAEYDEQAALGFPSQTDDVPLSLCTIIVLYGIPFALLALVVTLVAWVLSRLGVPVFAVVAIVVTLIAWGRRKLGVRVFALLGLVVTLVSWVRRKL